MKNKFLFAFVLFYTFCYADYLWAQSEYQEVKDITTDLLKAEKERQVLLIGNPRADSVCVAKKTMRIFCNDNAAYLSFREDNVQRIYSDLKQQIPAKYRKYKIQIWADGRPIEKHIPAYYRTGKDKALKWAPHVDVPLKKNTDKPYSLKAGMEDRHMAKSRMVLRTEVGPLGMAARPPHADRRGPLYAELRTPLPGSHVGECRCQCAVAS